MEEKPKAFGIDFTKCPNCASKKKLANEVLLKQIEKGNMPKNSRAFLYTHQSIIAGQPGTWLSAPVVISFYDVCVDCGTVYCIHAEIQTAVQGGKNIPKSGNPFSNS